MDDINLIRTVLTDEVDDHRETARTTLLHAIAAERAGDVPDAPPRKSAWNAARRVRALRWSVAGTGLVAATAAAVVALGAGPLAPAGPPPAAQPGEAAAPQTAQQFLLAAATQAERAPATSGKYWHTRWVSRYGSAGTAQTRIGVAEQWQAADPSQPSWWGSVRYNGGRYETSLDKTKRIGYGWEAEFSPAEVRALPTDPAALRAVLAAKGQKIQADGTPPGDDYLFAATAGLLGRAPAAPAQMAALYRLLASLPGVELDGTATDSEGRTGVLVRRGAAELIIDRGTYQVLAGKKLERGKLWNQSVYTHREWTNQEPVEPTLPATTQTK